MISFIIVFVTNLITDYKKIEFSKDYIDELKKCVIIYQMGYEEKAINNFYNLVDKDKLKESYEILNNKFDKKIIYTLKMISENKELKTNSKIDKKLFKILKDKKKKDIKKESIKKEKKLADIINDKIALSQNLKQMNLQKVKSLDAKNIYVYKNMNVASPENYHILYSISKNVNFLNKIKKKFPHYLKYNDL